MNVSRKDFAQDRKRFRAEAIRQVRRFIDMRVRNIETDAWIVISRKGVKHTTFKAGDELLMAATKLPELLRHARWIAARPDRKNRPNVHAAHSYNADISIDREPCIAHMTVIEDNHGNAFYDLGIFRKKGRDQRGKGANPNHHRHPVNRPFSDTIDSNPKKNKPA